MTQKTGIQQAKTPIYLDDLDAALENDVERTRMIALPELHKQHPDEKYSKIWYRVKTLGKIGRIRIARTRKNVVCYALNENEKKTASRANSKDGNTTIQNRRIDNVSVDQEQ